MLHWRNKLKTFIFVKVENYTLIKDHSLVSLFSVLSSWCKLRGLGWVKISKFLNNLRVFETTNNRDNPRHNCWNTSVFAQCAPYYPCAILMKHFELTWMHFAILQLSNGERFVDKYLVAVVIIISTKCDEDCRVKVETKVEHFLLKVPFTSLVKLNSLPKV